MRKSLQLACTSYLTPPPYQTHARYFAPLDRWRKLPHIKEDKVLLLLRTLSTCSCGSDHHTGQIQFMLAGVFMGYGVTVNGEIVFTCAVIAKLLHGDTEAGLHLKQAIIAV